VAVSTGPSFCAIPRRRPRTRVVIGVMTRPAATSHSNPPGRNRNYHRGIGCHPLCRQTPSDEAICRRDMIVAGDNSHGRNEHDRERG